MTIHQDNQLCLAVMQAGTDQIIQPIGRRLLHAVLDQKVYTAVENQTRFEMHPRHRGDLNGKGIARSVIKGREAIEIQNDILVPLPCLFGVGVRNKFRARQPQKSCDGLNIALVKILWLVKAFGRFEIPTHQKEADLAAGRTQALGDVHQPLGQVKVFLAITMIKQRWLVESLLFIGCEDAHSCHGCFCV
nr:hypothetical protein [Zongyanglinia marina]